MPSDLDELRSENSDRAVIGGKGLVKLCHVTANGRCLVDQVNLETSCGKIERGLNAADPSTNNHDVSEIALSETCLKLLELLFYHSLYLMCFRT